MGKVKNKWRAKRQGIRVEADLLINLRFADDILLIGRSLAQVRHVLEDVATEAFKVAFKFHMGKQEYYRQCPIDVDALCSSM